MGNRNILIRINSQNLQTDEYLDKLCLYDSDGLELDYGNCTDKEILSKNPFVKFVDSPSFMHTILNPENNKVEVQAMFVETYNGNIIDRVNSRDNRKKLFYILPYSGNEISQKGPIIYNPINFMPVESKPMTRLAMVDLTDRQIEDLIFEHDYIDDGVLDEGVRDEIFYCKDVHENYSFSPMSLPTITKKLISTKHKLSEKGYNMYCTLVERTRLPDEETFNRWLSRLEKIDCVNNDYMYILSRR